MAAGSSTTISSAQRPTVLMAAIWPPMALALPGLVRTVVTPASRASWKQWSKG